MTSRLRTIGLILLMLFALIGCSAGDEPTLQQNDPTPSAAPLDAAPETVEADTAEISPEDWLLQSVAAARAKHGIVGMGAIVMRRDGGFERVADGASSAQTGAPIAEDSAWHIGSNTKAITALLYGRLVEQGLAHWGATLPELFPELAADMHPDWSAVTIEHLFAHRSGIGQFGFPWLNARHRDTRPLTEQRLETVRSVLGEAPKAEAGAYEYSNLNYVVAGAAIEGIMARQGVADPSWEQAIKTEILTGLTDETARNGFGFGAPPQVEGHKVGLTGSLRPVGFGAGADNPAALGPAGTMNATLVAHALLGREFLLDESDLVSPALREKLLTPYPDAQSDYAMGWGIRDHPEYGRIYMHAGSNTYWLSRIAIVPDLGIVIIVNANQFGDGAIAATDEVMAEILRHEAEESVP